MLSLFLAVAPAEGLVPPPPGSPPDGEAPNDTVEAAVEEAPESPESQDDASPRPELQPQAPSPPPSVLPRSSEPPHEPSEFMDRSPPLAPVAPDWGEHDVDTVEPPSGKLVWGIHRPVAQWKRSGLIGSAALSGVTIAATVLSNIGAQRRAKVVLDYLALQNEETGGYPRGPVEACGESSIFSAGSQVVAVRDVELANKCQRFNRMRATTLVSFGLSVVGIVSTVTFGVLHLVHRDDGRRRVEARTDGFAVRF